MQWIRAPTSPDGAGFGQVWPLRTGAHGVLLASTKQDQVLLLRSTNSNSTLSVSSALRYRVDENISVSDHDPMYTSACEWREFCFRAQLSKLHMSLFTHGTGLIAERNCTWCAPGKYQTGLGLIDEVNCTWCVAGKYQTGSGSSSSNFGSDVFCSESVYELNPRHLFN